MTPTKRTKYTSALRAEQSRSTHARVVTAARKLVIAQGFDDTTIADIAREAGVSVQMVYALFGSKRGIIKVLIEKARFGQGYAEIVKRARAETDAHKRLAFVAQITRQIYEAGAAEIALLKKAGVATAELLAMEQEKDIERFETQKASALIGVRSGSARRPGDTQWIRQTLWVLTAFEPYRMLVVERGWSPAKYQAWLESTLVSVLLRD